MRIAQRLTLALTISLSTLAPAALPPVELAGTVTGVHGSTVELLGGRVRLDATSARVVRRADGAALGIGHVVPGAEIRVLAGAARPDGTLAAVEIRVGAAEAAEVKGTVSFVDAATRTFGLAGSTVATDEATFFSGETARGHVRSLADLAGGDFVEARLVPSGNGLLALSVHGDRSPEPAEATEIEFRGTLTAVAGGVWTVAGRPVSVTSQTVILRDPKVGDEVEVKAIDAGDGTLLALRIQREDGPAGSDDPPGDDGGGSGSGDDDPPGDDDGGSGSGDDDPPGDDDGGSGSGDDDPPGDDGGKGRSGGGDD